MINIRMSKEFCSEPIELVENYDKAIADTTQTWHLHHRWETDFSYSRQELIDIGEYYGITADKLIFLTPSEHMSLHGKGNKYRLGDKTSEETKKKMSKSHINNIKLSKPILQYTIDGEFIKEWVSMSEIQRQLGFNISLLCRCCKGERKTAYKYIWKYK